MYKNLIKTKYKFFKIVFIVFVIVFCNIISYATNEELEKISSNRSNIAKIEQEKKKVQDTIKKLNSLKNDTESFIVELDKTLVELTDELNLTLEKIDLKQIEIDETSEQLNVAKTNEEKKYNDMKLRIKFFYEHGNSSIFENILNGDNLNDILTKAEYIQSITLYDRQKLNQLIEVKNSIIEIEEKLKIEKDELVVLKEEEIARKANIESLLFEKQKELEDTNSKLNSNNKELKKIEADIKARENEIKAIEAKIAERERNAANKRVLSGGLVWPLPSSYRITSKFGKRTSPTKGASSMHEGIDIGAPIGDKVVAAASGEVVISKSSYSAGNYIMINHGSGVYTVYMHLNKRSVKEGDEVVIGQKIGEVGSTGYATGPHLHFGIRVNGKYVDPLTYVG